MSQLILLALTLGSLGVIVFIVYRKLPKLRELSAQELQGQETPIARARAIVSSRVNSQKITRMALTQARSLAEKTEAQTGEWLERLQKNTQARKGEFTQSYWEQLRKKARVRKKK
ncbi:MAG TPA: hypothetical protein VFE94_04265 [Candidatus Paceibacterota bacterium]|nr:hypothetical protein [Candidatus Paceibacterota bacterium]